MRKLRMWVTASCAAIAFAVGAAALAAQEKPANATAQCKDGTYSTAKSKSGACSSHGGVQTWFADEKGTVKSDAKAAGKATKDAAASAGKATAGAAKVVGKETKNASEKAGKATASGAETAAKATGHAAAATANAIKPKPSDAPKDATAKCKDGSYSTAQQHSGACSGHGGVAEWYK